MLAGIAGILIAPLFAVSADMGTLFGVKAFAVAILGGLGSARGVVLAGFAFGLVEALITSMLGSAYTNILAFVLVIVISRDARQQLLALKWIRGLLIVLALSAPWFVVMLQRNDGALVCR